jgi:DnaJ homolog subfamily C member 3
MSYQFKQQYASLKKLMKHIKTSDELLTKGYNHKALESLEFSLGAMRGMLMTSDTFRSNILLRMCRAYSKIKRHEEALASCDSVLEMRKAVSDPAALLEALIARSEVLSNDNDFSEASRDLNQALQLAEQALISSHRSLKSQELLQDVRRRHQEAQHSLRLWNERRDHNTVLELPANLDQLSQEKKCSWIKKQHHKLARKWHPDKYKGNRERGSRKMREVSEAKKDLLERHRCK